jgi:hypothetical protein
MKVLLITLITVVSAMAHAKGGGNQPMTPEKFMHDSVEHSLLLAKNAGAGMITATNAQAIDTETINVTFTSEDGATFSYQCILVDEISKGGTVMKKDVRCASF